MAAPKVSIHGFHLPAPPCIARKRAIEGERDGGRERGREGKGGREGGKGRREGGKGGGKGRREGMREREGEGRWREGEGERGEEGGEGETSELMPVKCLLLAKCILN